MFTSQTSELAMSYKSPSSARSNCQKRKKGNKKGSSAATEKTNSPMEIALTEFIHESRKNRARDENVAGAERDPEQLLFDSFALRMKKLPKQVQSFIQLQISQLFFNAENPDLPPIPITPLPRNVQSMQPCVPDFDESQSERPIWRDTCPKHFGRAGQRNECNIIFVREK